MFAFLHVVTSACEAANVTKSFPVRSVKQKGATKESITLPVIARDVWAVKVLVA